MSKLPKLKVTEWMDGRPHEKIYELERAKEFFTLDSSMLVSVNGEVLVSYGDLLRLVEQDHYRDREFIKVELAPLIGGG